MDLARLYRCPHCTKGYLRNLEHWKEYFQCQDDEYADEIVRMFEAQLHKVKNKSHYAEHIDYKLSNK